MFSAKIWWIFQDIDYIVNSEKTITKGPDVLYSTPKVIKNRKYVFKLENMFLS